MADVHPQDQDESSTFVEEVGRRLRAIRHQQGLSLEDVEERSGGRWSASAVGAYERGYSVLSLARLRELAEFYGVPMSVVVGEVDLREQPIPVAGPPKVILDLEALEKHDEAAPVARYAQSIALERGDFNGRVLSLRRDDLRVLGSLLGLSEPKLLERLAGWGVLSAVDGTATALDVE